MLHHCNKTCLLNISVNLRYFSQFISSKKLTNVSLFYCKLILSVICTFFFISPCDIISISRLSLMLKIIDQCDFKQVIILLIKSLTYKKWYIIISLTHYNTSDNVCLDFHNFHFSMINDKCWLTLQTEDFSPNVNLHWSSPEYVCPACLTNGDGWPSGLFNKQFLLSL